MSTKMTPRQRERCERAIATLQALKLPKGAKFRMTTWGDHPSDHKPSARNFCGTAACAAGWLSLDPWFRRRGMRGEWVEVDWKKALHLQPFGQKLGAFRQWTALEEYFGLTEEETDRVFGEENEGSAKDAARRFQRVLDARDRSAR